MRIAILTVLQLCLCTAAGAQTGWSIEAPPETIPDEPLEGEIFGRDFVVGSVTISEQALTIQSEGKSGFWPESEILIFVGTDDEQTEWVVTPNSDGMLPHIHMKFVKEEADFPGTLMYTGEYSMRLVFTNVTESTVEGKIHLSLPDYKKSYLSGSFTATVE